jgi:hypothetical protein
MWASTYITSGYTTERCEKMLTPKKIQRRGVPLSVRIRADLHDRLTARAAADEKSMTQTVERMLDLGFLEDRRLGGPSLISLFLAASEIARSQSYAAGLSEEEFQAAHWAKNPKLIERIAENFSGLVRMMADPAAANTNEEGAQ